MGRTSGTPNKITAEVRDKLQNLIDDLIKSLDIHELDTNQKIKMLQLSLRRCPPCDLMSFDRYPLIDIH